jgi:Domain of unknown function (DUF6468)
MMDMSLAIDSVVIVLLAATIFYAFRLERKLEGLRSAHTAFAGVVRDLNTAAARAEAGIQGLKLAAESSGEVLDERIKRARNAGDELGLVLQTAQRVVQRLDGPRAMAPMPRPQAPQTSEGLRAFAGKR